MDLSPAFTVQGKFFFRSDRKFFLKAMRLKGVQPPRDFSEKLALRDRLLKLTEAHTTGLVVKEADAEAVADLAGQVGMCLVVEAGIAPETLFDRGGLRGAQVELQRAVRAMAGRPVVAGYLIDCPIGQDLIKLHGLGQVQRRLRSLIAAVRSQDSRALVAVKHCPASRPASLLEEDFIYSTVSPLSPCELREYLVSLHNLAEARPVVIEFDQPMGDQDAMVECVFGLGSAGVVAPATRPAPRVDLLSLKMLRADELLPFLSLNGNCPPQPQRAPLISVVICAYNAERTMRDCLESLRRLDYPNYEVVIVDDGSRDRTAEISMDFPEFRLIRQPNKGLAIARNVGMQAARGEIIAYTDSDCVVDPHWLTMMIRTMLEGGFDGCGGPNYAPHEDGRVAACVAASPGAPCHVLVGDDRAEHLAGCNMVFRRTALRALGGFDPRFTAAGDDVDICWRMLDAGFKLGFSPAAFVWHFRRNTIKAYYGQQRGYGCAEALLYPKYPERFNLLGQIKWRGTIPGLARTMPGGGTRRVLWDTPRVGFATVGEPSLGLLSFLPQTLEWNVLAALMLVVSIVCGFSSIPPLLMLALGPIWALYYAWHAPLERVHASFTSRLLVAWLDYTGPAVRTITRLRLRLKALVGAGSFSEIRPRQHPEILPARCSLRLSYWNESYISRDKLLDRLSKLFARAGHPALIDPGWNDYDLEVRTGPLTHVRLKTADEEHGGLKLRNLVMIRVRVNRFGKIAPLVCVVAAGFTAALGLGGPAIAFVAATLAWSVLLLSEVVDSARIAIRAVEQSAQQLQL
ncbi:MAG: glycosyltransferase, partial [Candidatus Binataceae bacterium]